MRTISEVVAERLNKYMIDKNLTQYKLSQLSGVPYSTVKSIMQRRTKSIDFKNILLLSAGLNIKPSEFIDDPAFWAENLDI